MNWDIKELEEKYRKLDEMDESSVTPSLLEDKNNLVDMINYHFGEEKLDYTPTPYEIYDPAFFVDKSGNFGETVSDLCFEISGYQYVRPVMPFYLKGTKKDILGFDKLVEGYFQNFDESLLELYRRYKRENRIELRPYRYPHSTCSGKCFNFNHGESNYLSALYKGTLKNSSVLVHEVAHAGTAEKHATLKENQNYRLSIFCEALSKYHELCYGDYLYLNGNKNDGQSILGTELDNFSAVFECAYANLLSIGNKPAHGDRGIMYFMSSLMAFRLYYMAHEEPHRIAGEVELLDKSIGIVPDYEIFKHYGLENSRKYIDYAYKIYHNRKNSRQRQRIQVSTNIKNVCKGDK